MKNKRAGMFKAPPRMVAAITELFKRVMGMDVQIAILNELRKLRQNSPPHTRHDFSLDTIFDYAKSLAKKKMKSSVEEAIIALSIALDGVQKIVGFKVKPSNIERSFPKEVKKKIPYDFSGWDYAGQATLPKRRNGNILVTISLTPNNKGYFGSWSFKHNVLYLYPYEGHDRDDFLYGSEGIKNFSRMLKKLNITLEHELMHMSQQLLMDNPDDIEAITDRGLTEKGFPTKEQSTPSYRQDSEAMGNNESNYYLDDAEFFTQLKSNVGQLLSNLDRLPKSLHKKYIKDYISGQDMDRSLYSDYGLIYVDNYFQKMSPFFFYLKEYAPAKYRRAVKETVSILSRKGYL